MSLASVEAMTLSSPEQHDLRLRSRHENAGGNATPRNPAQGTAQGGQTAATSLAPATPFLWNFGYLYSKYEMHTDKGHNGRPA